MENLKNTDKTSENAEKELRISDVIGIKKIELTTDELLNLLKEAYRNGYATYEMVDAGLEPYDADGYARWVLLGLK
jgi:G3E family GTPase